MDLLDELPLPMLGQQIYEGLIKVKLVHARGFTVLLPDLLVIGSKWYQARFFTAPRLSWLDEATCCQFSFELDPNKKLTIHFTGDRLLSHQPDGSSVYRCRLYGPSNLENFADGDCEVDDNGNVALWLYHHTKPENVQAIRASGHFRSTDWNIQGTIKKLVNIHYVYFTSLPRITSNEDLVRIAMSSDGFIRLSRTNAPKDIISLRVYRGKTDDRCASLRVLVPAALLASQHVYYEAPHHSFVYYAICHPEIFRVGLHPGKVLPFENDRVIVHSADLHRFDYVVLGHADTRIGLCAPYDEENTPAIFKIERMHGDDDLFTLWQRHSNSNRFDGYTIEMPRFMRFSGYDG
jgi:hypothetical protein